MKKAWASLNSDRTKLPWPDHRGFTIVELLIVIVVIGILAAIAVVAYNGVQARARDAQRKQDIAAITKALELYYQDKGQYPTAAGGPGYTYGNGWNSTADSSWQELTNHLKPYMSFVPKDPISTPNTYANSTARGYNYGYMSWSYCGSQRYHMYLLVYRLESEGQSNKFTGECTEDIVYPHPGASNNRVVR